MLSRILKNTSANYALKILQMGLSIASVPILVSSIGTEGYGLIILAGTVLGYFMFFDLGLSSGVTKYVAQYHSKKDYDALAKVISTSLALFLFIGVMVGLVLYGLVELGLLRLFSISKTIEPQAEQVFTLAAIFSLFAWPQLVFQGVMTGLQDFVSLNLVKGIGRVVAVSLAIYAALKGESLVVIFVAMQLDILLSLVLLPLLIRRRLPDWRFHFCDVRVATFSMMWGFSSWLMLGQIAVLLEYQLDTLLIGVFLPVAAITTYIVVTYPFRILQQISGLAASAVMPAVSARHSVGGDDAIEGFLIKGARIHNAFLAISTVIALFVVKPFLTLWMGESYLEYLWLALLACFFQFFWQSNSLLGQVYYGTGRSRKPGIVAIVTGLTNLVFSLILVQYFGVAGVVLGTVIAGIFGVFLFVGWCLSDMGVSVGKYVNNILIAGQGPIWLAGLALLPFYGWISSITGWVQLVIAVICLLMILSSVAYKFVLSADDRQIINSRLMRTPK